MCWIIGVNDKSIFTEAAMVGTRLSENWVKLFIFGLPAILALTCVATMCGYRGYRAFPEWNYGKELMKALWFTHEKGPCEGPCAAASSNVFRWLNVELLGEKLGGC